MAIGATLPEGPAVAVASGSASARARQGYAAGSPLTLFRAVRATTRLSRSVTMTVSRTFVRRPRSPFSAGLTMRRHCTVDAPDRPGRAGVRVAGWRPKTIRAPTRLGSGLLGPTREDHCVLL